MWKSLTKPLTYHTYHISNPTRSEIAQVQSTHQTAGDTTDCTLTPAVTQPVYSSGQLKKTACLFLWQSIKEQKLECLRTFREDADHFRTRLRHCGGPRTQICLIMQLCVRLSAEYWPFRPGCWTLWPAAFTSLTFLVLAQAKPSQRAIERRWKHASALICHAERDVKLWFEVELCERCISHAVGRNVEAAVGVIVRTVCAGGTRGS